MSNRLIISNFNSTSNNKHIINSIWNTPPATNLDNTNHMTCVKPEEKESKLIKPANKLNKQNKTRKQPKQNGRTQQKPNRRQTSKRSQTNLS